MCNKSIKEQQMNNIDLRPGISILLNSWGSDTPPEVYWVLIN